MKKTSIVQLSSAIALVAATLIAPGSALAQSGSRLCGWTTDMGHPGVAAMGLLYEARTKDASYKKQCDEVIDTMNKKIKEDKGTAASGDKPAMPPLSTYTWKKVSRATCEDIGGMFKSNDHDNTDMCDYMDSKQAYSVLKKTDPTTRTSTTTYTKK